jgi:hypothetical protein
MPTKFKNSLVLGFHSGLWYRMYRQTIHGIISNYLITFSELSLSHKLDLDLENWGQPA